MARVKSGTREADQFWTYLRARGIPSSVLKDMQKALTNDAIQESMCMQWDRIYTALAAMLRLEYGFGPERITRGMTMFDRICGAADEGAFWRLLMQMLDEECGIVIDTPNPNEGTRFVREYTGYDKKRSEDIRKKIEEYLEK